MIKQQVIAILEKAINHYLQLDGETVTRLAAFSGKVIAVEETHFNFKFYLVITTAGIQLRDQYSAAADTVIKGPLFGLLRLYNTTNTISPSVTSGKVTISGDVALGQEIQTIIKNIDIDWEEQLSHLTSDVIAHQVGNVARGVMGWMQQSAVSLRKNLTEYLQEEARYLPTRIELDDFGRDVAVLRDDVERLEQRIQRLQHNKKGNS